MDPIEELDSNAILGRARQRCSEVGAKLTTKRGQVLEGLVRSEKALSAYELADFCREEMGYELLPMSVYRILEFLENNQLVHRLNTSNKYIACSHISCAHNHQPPQFLICKTCFKVEEVNIPQPVLNTVEKTTETAGFRLASKQLEIECYCLDCESEGLEVTS